MSEKLTWRPIDTAPKDGTTILLSDGTQVDAASWSEWGGKANWDFADSWFEPTYWMPLPDPPYAQGHEIKA